MEKDQDSRGTWGCVRGRHPPARVGARGWPLEGMAGRGTESLLDLSCQWIGTNRSFIKKKVIYPKQRSEINLLAGWRRGGTEGRRGRACQKSMTVITGWGGDEQYVNGVLATGKRKKTKKFLMKKRRRARPECKNGWRGRCRRGSAGLLLLWS